MKHVESRQDLENLFRVREEYFECFDDHKELDQIFKEINSFQYQEEWPQRIIDELSSKAKSFAVELEEANA